MSPEYVRPYVKARKNDDRDAEAIAEAATHPTMRFVELKSEEQLDVQTLHRVRDRLVGDRTSLTKQIRSLLLERGYTVAQGHARLRRLLADLLAPGAGDLSPRVAFLLGDMRTRWDELDRRIAAFDAEFAAMARTDERARRLTTIPGIGALNATGPGGCGRRCRDIREGTRPCRMAGTGASSGHDRRQATAGGDHEARQPLPAQDADPRRAICHAFTGKDRHGHRIVAARAAGPQPSQCRRRRIGGEDGAHRLGPASPRPDLSG